MRNLKRALSLVMASVMLLGMMVIGTSAAGTTFTDDRQIANSEAAAITGGLGIFSGYPDGSFGAKNVVTRAEMATIVVKMLYGADYNADPFKGTSKFSDVADYQGGWAEGYVNVCASLGIIAGYPDGTFKPGNTLTTAEAITFIINALGIDAGKGDWPVTVMSKGAELGLFGDLVPKTDAGMTRDDLSVLVYEGLKYSPDAGQKWTLDGIEFDSMNDALLYKAITQSANNPVPVADLKGSLAEKVFHLKKELILITGNAATEVQHKGDAVKTTEGMIWSTRNEQTPTVHEWYVDTAIELIGCVAEVYWNDKDGEGDYDKLTEPVYTLMNKSKIKVIASALDKQTPAQVKELFGLKNTPAVQATKTPYAFFSYNNITGVAEEDQLYMTGAGWHKDVFTVDSSKLDVANGTYTIYDGELVSYNRSVGRVVPYYVYNPTKGDGYFTVRDYNGVNTGTGIEKNKVITEYGEALGGNNVNVIANYTSGGEAYNSIINIKDIDFDQMDSGVYVYISNFTGEKRSLAAPSVITGTMEAFSMNTTVGANAKMTVNGTQYNIQPVAYDDDILTGLKNSSGVNAKHLAGQLAQSNSAHADWDKPNNTAWRFGNHESGAANYATEYEFIAAGSYIFAYREKGTAAPKKTLVVPVYKYELNEEQGTYGETGGKTYWIQAVDMDGDEVIQQVTKNEWDAFEAYTGDDTNTANVTEVAGQIKAKAFYTFTTSYNSSLKATVADFTAVAANSDTTTYASASSSAITDDYSTAELTKSVSDGTNAYYLNDGFKVLYVSGTKDSLKVTIKDGSYKNLENGALVYGQKAASSDKWYDLQYMLVDGAYSAGPEDGTDIIYLTGALTMANAKAYKDAAGNTYTGYFQTAYINGVKDTTTIFTARSEVSDIGTELNALGSNAYKGSFYTYTKDPVTGTYDLTRYTGDNTHTVVLCQLVTRNVNGVISVNGITDMDVSEAIFVNLVTSGTTASITDPAKLTTSNKISVLYNELTGKAEQIIVIA